MRRIRTTLIIAISLLYFTSCNDKPTDPGGGGGGGGSTSTLVTEIGPADRSTDQPLIVVLRWAVPDSLRRALTYDVYFGPATQQALVASARRYPYWQSYALNPASAYLWRVVARDTAGAEYNSTDWTFETVKDGGSVSEYPVAVGNRWQYSDTGYYDNIFASDSSVLPQIIQDGPIQVDIAGDTMLNLDGSLEQFLMFAHWNRSYFGGDCYDTALYRYKSGKLLLYDENPSCGGFYTPRVVPGSAGATLNEDRMRLIPTSSGAPGGIFTALGSPPPPELLSFEFPLRLGSTWTMRNASSTGGGFDLNIDKTVIDFENVDLDSESFECAVVRWVYHGGDSGLFTGIIVTDYVATVGLVKRTVAQLGLVYTDETNSYVAEYDRVQETALQSYHIAQE